MESIVEYFVLLFAGVVFVLAFALLVGVGVYKKMFASRGRREPVEIDHAALDAAERQLRASDETDWVVVKRCHGPAYTHTAMSAIVGALMEGGVEATYDVVGTSSADGGVTNYMLKVIRGSEERALEILSQKNY